MVSPTGVSRRRATLIGPLSPALEIPPPEDDSERNRGCDDEPGREVVASRGCSEIDRWPRSERLACGLLGTADVPLVVGPPIGGVEEAPERRPGRRRRDVRAL